MSKSLSIALALCLSLASFHLMAQSNVLAASAQISEALRSGGGGKGQFLIAKGSGLPADWAKTFGEKKVSALTAAEVIAKAKLLETVIGVTLDIQTKVKNFKISEAEIEARAKGLLRGAQIYHNEYDDREGIAYAYARMSIVGRGGLYHMLSPLLRSSTEDSSLPRYRGGAGGGSQADGLIIDVTDFFDFEPALVQFILSEQNEVLYGPDKVSQKWLVRRGMASYSNDLGKAKAILGELGSQNPLLITATALSNNRPQVSRKDAARIFSANQEKQFLERATVVFLLEN